MIGISTNCECGDTLAETVANIKAAGFGNVMLAQGGRGNFEEDIKTVLAAGLKIPFVHLYSNLANGIWQGGNKRDKFIKSIGDAVRLCGKYGIPVALFHGSHVMDAVSDPGSIGVHAIEAVKEILAIAEQSNVKVAIENLEGVNFAHFCYLMDNIKSLGFCYDCGHHNLFIPEVDLIGKYGDRIIAVHLHDNNMDWSGRGWNHDRHLLPFDGKIDFNRVARDLNRSAYRGVVMMELHREDDYDHMSSREFLSEAFKRGQKLENLLFSMMR